jgi:hypothetical protein
MKPPAALDAIADKVLSYRPKDKAQKLRKKARKQKRKKARK